MYYLQLNLNPTQLRKVKKIWKHGDKYAGYIRISKKQLDWNNRQNHEGQDLIKINREELKRINTYNKKKDKNKKGFDIYITRERLIEQMPFQNGGTITIDKLIGETRRNDLDKATINKSIKNILFPIHPLTNFDIEGYAKLLQLNLKVLPRNLIKYEHINRPNSAVVINLDDDKGQGTHWTCIIHHPDKKIEKGILYYDSYGIEYPPQEVMDMNIKNLVANDSTHQYLGENSILCGYYCLKVIKSIFIDKMDYDDALDQFNELDDIYEKDLENMDIADNLFL
jgi:hypothetical protein